MFKKQGRKAIFATVAIILNLSLALYVVVYASTGSVVYSILSGVGLALYLTCETIVRTRRHGN